MKQLLADYLGIYSEFIESILLRVAVHEYISADVFYEVNYWTHKTADNKGRAEVQLDDLLTFIYNKDK